MKTKLISFIVLGFSILFLFTGCSSTPTQDDLAQDQEVVTVKRSELQQLQKAYLQQQSAPSIIPQQPIYQPATPAPTQAPIINNVIMPPPTVNNVFNNSGQNNANGHTPQPVAYQQPPISYPAAPQVAYPIASHYSPYAYGNDVTQRRHFGYGYDPYFMQ
jgi:hypothetical protein